MFAGIERDAQQSDIGLQGWRSLPVLESGPTAIERRLQDKDAFLIEAHRSRRFCFDERK